MRSPLAIAVALTLACVSFVTIKPKPSGERRPDPRVMAAHQVDSSIEYSNILPRDYVGPETCAECHSSQHEQWSEHSHACMNQIPSRKSVGGDFANAELILPTGKVLFQNEPDAQGELEFKMLVFRNHESTPFREYLITKTVGSRFVQAYIGKQLRGPESLGHAIYQEHKLPFAYWFKIKQWLPEAYFNITDDEPLVDGVAQTKSIDLDPRVLPYTETCMNCHNTFSYAYRIYHKALVGFPDAVVAAAIQPLAKELSSERRQVQPTVHGFNRLNENLNPQKDLVSLGISCESCHLGGREHVEHQRAINFLPTSKYIKLKPQSKTTLIENREHGPTLMGTCAQCHTGEGELFHNGGGKSNSRESRDLHAGFCASQISCVNCHDPHQGSQEPSGGAVNQLHVDQCIQCHPKYQTVEARRQHGGFAAHRALSCLDCHMPRYTRGVDELIRTHRITNPVEEVMVRNGSANACNACHLDRSTQWTLDSLRHGWNRRLTPTVDWSVHDDLNKPVGELWLHSQDSHLRLMASQLYLRPETPCDPTLKSKELISMLNDPQRINRVFATFSVKRLLGLEMDTRIPVILTDSPESRQRQIEAWLKELGQ